MMVAELGRSRPGMADGAPPAGSKRLLDPYLAGGVAAIGDRDLEAIADQAVVGNLGRAIALADEHEVRPQRQAKLVAAAPARDGGDLDIAGRLAGDGDVDGDRAGSERADLAGGAGVGEL